MKKIVLLFSLVLLILLVPSVFAINIEVEKTSTGEVLVSDIDKPAVFTLNITNLGPSDSFEFYNLVGFSISPSGKVSIASGETREVQIEVSPIGNPPQKGFYTFDLYIKASDSTEQIEQLTFKITDLSGALSIGSEAIDPELTQTTIFIRNLENIDFGTLSADFSSPFFEASESFTLGPRETKTFTVQLTPENFKDLVAGFYTIEAEVSSGTTTTVVEGTVEFIEKNIVTTTRKDFGFFINTQIIEKKNEGNLVESSETVIKKNVVSRLFTSFTPSPDIVEREGASVYYTWVRDVRPGETLTITVKTNWFFPLLIIAFIVAIVVFVKKYSGTNVSLRKKVTFVNAKGGEFALKVSILVNAKNYVERVNIIDRLPPLVDVYERFGGEHPSRIDKANRKIEWNFEKLESGETRVLSYIIYSKVGVMGKFALPTATAIYEREGKIQEAASNRAFFVAEQRSKDVKEE
jgi:hypothetical protein